MVCIIPQELTALENILTQYPTYGSEKGCMHRLSDFRENIFTVSCKSNETSGVYPSILSIELQDVPFLMYVAIIQINVSKLGEGKLGRAMTMTPFNLLDGQWSQWIFVDQNFVVNLGFLNLHLD